MAALTTGMLDRAMCSGLLRMLTVKLALKLGSSKQGKAFLALVGSKCVEARTLGRQRQQEHTYNTLTNYKT